MWIKTGALGWLIKLSSRGKKLAFYGPAHFIPTWNKFLEISKRDGQSASSLLCIWIEGYVHRKDPGNPQRPLTAYSSGHEDEITRIEQDIFNKFLAIAEQDNGHIRRIRILQELMPMLKGQQRVDVADKFTRRLTKAGVKVVR